MAFFNQVPAFGQPAAPAFGQQAAAPAFGAAAPAFGQQAAAPAFGAAAPAFGQQAAAPAFGQAAAPAFGQQAAASAFGQPTAGAVAADYKVPGAQGAVATCSDGITSVNFSAQNLMLASSWDGHVRVWQVQKQGPQIHAAMAGQVSCDGQPVLSSCFNGDGSAAVAGCGDNTVRMWQFQGAATSTIIGRHDQPVKSVHWMSNNMVASGSWDATVRFWDTRSPTEAYKLQLPSKVYAMDVQYPVMAVATAEVAPGAVGHPLIRVYDMRSGAPQLFGNTPIQSTLKHQPRCLGIFNTTTQGFAVGSIEGRVDIKDLGALNDAKRSFAFKCHRVKQEVARAQKEHNHVYPVNAIAFNSRGTFATAGGDGVFSFWDKEKRTRIKEYRPAQGTCRAAQMVPQGQPPHPITAVAFSPTSEMFAYATSYDWARGDDPAMAARPNDIYIHACDESDLVAPPPQPTHGRGRR